MSNVEIGLVSLVVIVALIQTGLHVAVALALVSFVGVFLVRGDMSIAGALLTHAALESVARYSFGVIPLFVLMGVLVGVSGLGRDIFDVAGQLFRRVRGGLAIATVCANAVFAAVNGTSIASASVFTKVAVPELMKQGYTPRFSVGVVAGSSVLGMLIPPSLLLILYGIIAEVSIGALFTAGIVPGIVLAFFFILLILFLTTFFPSFTGVPNEPAGQELMSPTVLFVKAAPIAFLVLLVLGGIYGGFFTPTEAGGVGAMGALVIAIARRSLSYKQFGKLLIETGQVTASITFLIIAAHMYSRLLALTGVPGAMVGMMEAAGLGFFAVMALYLLVIIILGTILDSASIMLILLPLMVPVVAQFDVNLIWFGIVTVIAVEVGLLTPPLGVACFVIKANLDDKSISLSNIFSGAGPFALVMVVMTALILFVPGIALLLL
ncbi:TRAP transporter large permease [Mesorhizobium sp. Z1-4]|uniref:TRAP transporter large permease n=1 Tax=Mesorhizobium sp. Z1-4 TaxID=2448478 RepID=UPI000FD8166B|nr:TRAP transporter large permease [Mesorhizobium sp. Z1-4]